MNTFRRMISVTLALAIAGMSLAVQAQQQRGAYRLNDRQVRQVLNRLDNRMSVFRQNLTEALNSSRYDDRNREANINDTVSQFHDALDRLRYNFNNKRDTKQDAQEVLNRASGVDNFMRRVKLGGNVDVDWANIRNDLTELARLYNVTWSWSSQSQYPPYGQGNGGVYGPGRPLDRLTGTYRLDTSRSDDPQSAAERATRGLPYRDRQRIQDALTARLEAPDAIALERRGRNFTIASSRAPQISFEADGREHIERLDNGRSVSVSATLSGDQLIISQTGDTGNDYSVTFDSLNNGRTLRVTRRVSAERLTQPVVVQSLYNKTADIAQLDIYDGNTPGYPGNPSGGVNSSGGFLVPDGTQLVAVLNDNLTTKDARDNDRFTMTVTSPSQYDGATIEGYVSNVNRSGRITGRSAMTLNFKRIRLRDGSSYRFAGLVDSVRTSGGETVRVDNEGTVQDSDSRGSTTAKRAAIGTAVGAIIGAIAGGGKGAAIGAIVGAGAGAGSVYVQGKDDLELLSGTEVTVRASAPR